MPPRGLREELVRHGRRLAADLRETREALWREELADLRSRLGRTAGKLPRNPQSAPWQAAWLSQ